MPEGTLRVSRTGTGIELRRGTFDVTIDGKRTASLNHGDTVELPIAVGHHSLCIQAGRYASRVADFDLGAGDIVVFRCHGAMLWPRYVVSVVVPRLAIALKRE
ncbi:MAG: hypothetical protein M0020_01480 [Actinomycetota bacterium]|nr:hypothetical protein [Actinomycetota bacterium]